MLVSSSFARMKTRKNTAFSGQCHLSATFFPGRTSTFENRWDDKQAMGYQLERKITRIFHASVQTLVPRIPYSRARVGSRYMDLKLSSMYGWSIFRFLIPIIWMFGSFFLIPTKELHGLSLGISPIFVDPHSQYNSHFHCVLQWEPIRTDYFQGFGSMSTWHV